MLIASRSLDRDANDWRSMVAAATRDPRHVYLATVLATPPQKRIAFIIGAVALFIFAAMVPFVRVPLVRLPAFRVGDVGRNA